MIKNMMVRDLPELERPREKLIAHGVKVLSNVELLAVFVALWHETVICFACGRKFIVAV